MAAIVSAPDNRSSNTWRICSTSNFWWLGKNGQIFFLIDSEKIIMITNSDIFSSNVEKPKKKIPIRGRTKNQIYAESLKRPSIEQIYATSSGSWEENCKNVLHKTDGWSPIGHTAERMKRSLAVQSLRLAWVQTLSSVGWYHKVVGWNLTIRVKFNSITLVS